MVAINVDQLGRLLTVLAQVRDLLTEFPSQPQLVAIRDELVAQVRATKT